MELQELYRLIDLQPEIVEKLRGIDEKTDLAQIDEYLEQMMDIKTAEQSYRYLLDWYQEDADQLKMLYCQLECARRVYDRYQEKGISREIYADTMKCFTRFIEECGEKNGRLLFDRGWWSFRQISMEIFRLGVLEYQFQKYEGENVISIHIPSDADLSENAVESSLEQADVFFRTFYESFQYDKYTCHSWLLSQVLKDLLPENSRILAFQKRFDVIREDKENKEYMEWLFKAPENAEPCGLPEDTMLQRKVKKLLLKGGAIGSAYGILKGR